MRKIKWSEYKVKRSSFIKTRAKLGFKRGSSSRIRDEAGRKLLLKLDQARLESWKKKGKLKIIGPRKIKFKV